MPFCVWSIKYLEIEILIIKYWKEIKNIYIYVPNKNSRFPQDNPVKLNIIWLKL